MTTETAENTIKRTKVMQNRYALLWPVSLGSDVYKYDRDASTRPTLIQINPMELGEIKEGIFDSLVGLGTPKILKPSIESIAYGAKLTQVVNEETPNITAKDIMVLEFEPGSKYPDSMQYLSNY